MNTALLGLYVHIPFCKQKCIYCDFYSLPNGEDRMDAYTDALCAHLAETAPFAAGRRVDTVYFGGGTPSYLGVKRLTRILKVIQKKYRLDKGAEITLEANPDSAGDWKALRSLRRAGFNRLSLGMQSACDEELRSIGRVHTMAQATAAVEAARRAKFQNLSLDLIYGLPGQTLDRWRENLAAAAALEPEHLSCYGLKVEEGTPLYARRETADLPGDELQADMYLWTVDFLRDRGYAQYEISNFARPGLESRHNLKYWTLQEYAGFGPGAHSDFGGVRYAYTKDLEGYIRGVAGHAPMLSESETIPPLDRDTEWLMLGLRTARGLDPMVFEQRFRRRFSCFQPFLQTCQSAGYACLEDGRWRLTPQGFLVSNQIIGGMLDALAADKRRRAEAAARGDFRVQPGETEVRPLAQSETAAALDLAWRVFQASVAPSYPPEGTASFRRFLDDPAAVGALRLYGAFRQGRLAGLLAMRERHVALFFVEGSFQRQGLGKALFRRMRRDLGDGPLTVNAAPGAVSAYGRLGFSATGPEQLTDGIRCLPMACPGP